MDTQTILLDSSILIEYFRKENKEKSVLFRFSGDHNFCLSAITVFEIKIGLKSERQWDDYRVLTRNLENLPIDLSCVDKAVEIFQLLKKQNKLIELADLLIAATALSNSLPLLTLNAKHFENIPALKLIDIPAI